MRHFLLLPLALLAAGCGSSPSATTPSSDEMAAAPADGEVYRSVRHDFAVTYPADLETTVDFGRDYLQMDGWTLTALPDAATGTPVVALVMPGSNEVTAGELRIGISPAPADVAACDSVPMEALPDSGGSREINGIPFTTYEIGTAGMSHFLQAHAFRTVHENTCYAIDVLAAGTNPEVYDPPVTPPFTAEEVFAKLLPVVETFRFLEAE